LPVASKTGEPSNSVRARVITFVRILSCNGGIQQERLSVAKAIARV